MLLQAARSGLGANPAGRKDTTTFRRPGSSVGFRSLRGVSELGTVTQHQIHAGRANALNERVQDRFGVIRQYHSCRVRLRRGASSAPPPEINSGLRNGCQPFLGYSASRLGRLDQLRRARFLSGLVIRRRKGSAQGEKRGNRQAVNK